MKFKFFSLLLSILTCGLVSAQNNQPTLGIGLIINPENNDRICYDFYQFFVDNPIVANGTPLKVMLVDDPYQTDYAITGTYKMSAVPNPYYKNEQNIDSLMATITELKIWKNKEIVKTIHDTISCEMAYDLNAIKKAKPWYKCTSNENAINYICRAYDPSGHWGANFNLFPTDGNYPVFLELKGILAKSYASINALCGNTAKIKEDKLNLKNISSRRIKPSYIVEEICGDEIESVVGYITAVVEKKALYANHKVSTIVPTFAPIAWTDADFTKENYAGKLPFKVYNMAETKNKLQYMEDFFTIHYRAIMFNEFDFRGLPSEFIEKIKPLYHKKNTNPGAPLFLEYLAKQTDMLQDKALPAHFYWSALLLTNDLNASTPVKIDIRKRCIEGLTETAKQRGQALYSSLLNLDVKLSDEYLKSEKAIKENDQYNANMAELHKQLESLDIITETQFELNEQERLLRKKQNSAGAIATSVATGVILGDKVGKSYDKMREARYEKMKQELGLYQEKIYQLMYKNLSNTAQNEKLFKKLEGDVSDIETGKAFIAYDIWFHALNNKQKTIELLKDFAKDKPQLNKLVQVYTTAPAKDQALQNIVKKLVEYEVVCNLYERKGKAIPQNYLDEKL